MRLAEEKRRIVEHPLFFDGTWSAKPKVTFDENVVFIRKDSEDSTQDN